MKKIFKIILEVLFAIALIVFIGVVISSAVVLLGAGNGMTISA